MDKPEKVTDIMTKRVIVLREEDNLARLSEGMERYHLRHLPVTSDDRLVGLITHRDLLRLTVSSLMADDPTEQDKQSKLFENTFVAEVMTPDPMTVNPDTPIKEAAKSWLKPSMGACRWSMRNRCSWGLSPSTTLSISWSICWKKTSGALDLKIASAQTSPLIL